MTKAKARNLDNAMANRRQQLPVVQPPFLARRSIPNPTPPHPHDPFNLSQEMTKAQARNLDDVMARIRRRLNERASLSSGGSASSYLFYPPAAYGAPGPWGGPAGGYSGYGSYAYPSAYGGQPTPYYPFAAPPRASVDAASAAGSSRDGTPPLGTAAAAPLSTPPGSELLNQANMRRVLAQIGAELAQIAEADPTGQTDTEVLGRCVNGVGCVWDAGNLPVC